MYWTLLGKRAFLERTIKQRALLERTIKQRALLERTVKQRALLKRTVKKRPLLERKVKQRALLYRFTSLVPRPHPLRQVRSERGIEGVVWGRDGITEILVDCSLASSPGPNFSRKIFATTDARQIGRNAKNEGLVSTAGVVVRMRQPLPRIWVIADVSKIC